MEKIWAIFATTVTVLLLSFFTYITIVSYQAQQLIPEALPIPKQPTQQIPIPTNETPKPETETTTAPKKINILLLGVDARDGKLTGRTDTMIVVTLDKENDTMKMLSIPRDSYVWINKKQRYDKVTHAFSYGGAETSIKAVEDLLEINIDHYAVFNFTSFMEFINTLGGIEIDVPYDFSEQNSKGVKDAIRLKKGLQTLDAEQALAYVRMRKKDPTGDVGRGKRQQEVVQATLNKLISVQSIPKFTEIYTITKESTETDIGLTDIPKFAPYITTFGSMQSLTLRGKGQRIDGIYYYKLDEETLSAIKIELQN